MLSFPARHTYLAVPKTRMKEGFFCLRQVQSAVFGSQLGMLRWACRTQQLHGLCLKWGRCHAWGPLQFSPTASGSVLTVDAEACSRGVSLGSAKLRLAQCCAGAQVYDKYLPEMQQLFWATWKTYFELLCLWHLWFCLLKQFQCCLLEVAGVLFFIFVL